MKFNLSDDSINELQVASMGKFMELVQNGAKTIDIHVRRDGVQHVFQADYLKYLKVEVPYDFAEQKARSEALGERIRAAEAERAKRGA